MTDLRHALTLSVAPYTTLASYAGQFTATVSSVTFSSNVAANDNVIFLSKRRRSNGRPRRRLSMAQH